MTDPESDTDDSGTTRRRFLGAAATLAALPATIPDTSQTQEPDVFTPRLMYYVSDNLLHPAMNELTRADGGDIERTRFLLQHALTLVDEHLIESDNPRSVPHRPEYEAEYKED